MTTDNRTSEPTPEQVEAAAKAMYEEERSQTLEGQQWPRWHELCEDNPWSSRCGHKGTKVPYLTLARAALVAAQGAAPPVGRRPKRLLNQLNRIADALEEYVFEGVAADAPAWMRKAAEYIESECQWRAPVLPSSTTPQAEAYDHCCQHPKCPGGSLCCCASEQRLRDCWNQWREEIAGDSKQAFRDGYQAGQNDPAPWLTAPVLPSSGVDEDALAEVIQASAAEWGDSDRVNNVLSQYIARAVAEWLDASESRKEQQQ